MQVQRINRLLDVSRCNAMCEAQGLTAIELMVVVAIVSVLAALALPSFETVVERYRVRSAVEGLRSSIYLARSEAINRGGNVTLRSASSSDCTPGAKNEWSCGWLLFVDSNSNGVMDAGESRIQSASAPKGVIAKISVGVGAHDFVRFSRWGDVGALALSFRLYPVGKDDVASLNSMLCISAGGRLNAIHGVAQCAG